MMKTDNIADQLKNIDIEEAESFRKTKETAILALMFIDMVHSTTLREEIGELQFEKLRQQKKNELTAIIEEDNSGKVIKDIGDGLLGIFALPDTVVKRALTIQETLVSYPVFKVRIGVDMGQVTQELEKGIVKDVFGRHVNRAARLESLSDGGHILVSYPLWDSAKGWLKHLDHIHWKKHGTYWLKGFSEPQLVYEPYDLRITKPLPHLKGERVNTEQLQKIKSETSDSLESQEFIETQLRKLIEKHNDDFCKAFKSKDVRYLEATTTPKGLPHSTRHVETLLQKDDIKSVRFVMFSIVSWDKMADQRYKVIVDETWEHQYKDNRKIQSSVRNIYEITLSGRNWMINSCEVLKPFQRAKVNPPKIDS